MSPCPRRAGPLVVVLVGAVALVAGCSGGSSGSTSSVPETTGGPRATTTTVTTSPPTTVPPASTVATGSASDLQAILTERDVCQVAREAPQATIVPLNSAVYCDDYGILVFPTVADRDTAIAIIAGLPCRFPTYLAVGPDWVVWPLPATSFRAAEATEALGGEVRELACD